MMHKSPEQNWDHRSADISFGMELQYYRRVVTDEIIKKHDLPNGIAPLAVTELRPTPCAFGYERTNLCLNNYAPE